MLLVCGAVAYQYCNQPKRTQRKAQPSTTTVNYAGSTLLWKRELAPASSPENFTSISVDPLDRRRIVLCGDAGALVVLRLRGVGDGHHGGGGGEEVVQRQYRVNVQPPTAAQQRDAGGWVSGLDAVRSVVVQSSSKQFEAFQLHSTRATLKAQGTLKPVHPNPTHTRPQPTNQPHQTSSSSSPSKPASVQRVIYSWCCCQRSCWCLIWSWGSRPRRHRWGRGRCRSAACWGCMERGCRM